MNRFKAQTDARAMLMSLKEFCSIPKQNMDENTTTYAVWVYKILEGFNFNEEQSIGAIASQLELEPCDSWDKLMREINSREPTENQIRKESLNLRNAIIQRRPFDAMHNLRTIKDIMVAHYHRIPVSLHQFKATIIPTLTPILATKFTETISKYLNNPNNSLSNFKQAAEQTIAT